ncbi:MAG: DUF5069 domain-containing protein [Nitrospirota bacterium]
MSPPPPLRSPRDTLGGYVFLPRLIDKVRLHARGALPPAYLPQLLGESGTLDGRFVVFTGLDREALRAAILSAPDDAAVLAWVEQHAVPHSEDENRAWISAIDAYRPDPDRTRRRAQLYPELAARFDVATLSLFDLIDLDEGRIDRPTS